MLAELDLAWDEVVEQLNMKAFQMRGANWLIDKSPADIPVRVHASHPCLAHGQHVWLAKGAGFLRMCCGGAVEICYRDLLPPTKKERENARHEGHTRGATGQRRGPRQSSATENQPVGPESGALARPRLH